MRHYLHERSFSWRTAFAGGIAALLLSGAALAHTGGGHAHTHFSSLLAGGSHPFTGIDHLLAMFAVGLWAGQLGGRAAWAVPAGFIVLMGLGGAVAMAGFPIPAIEPGIVVSLVILGLAIAAAVRVPAIIGAAGVGLFAIFHGAAHGLEMPQEGASLAYAVGFILATSFLHLGGVLMARGLLRYDLAFIARLAGAAIGAAGLLLIAQ